MKTSVIALLVCVAGVAAIQVPDQPMFWSQGYRGYRIYDSTADRPRWVKSPGLSVEPNGNEFDFARLEKSFDGWDGTRPGVIDKSNARVRNDQLQLTVHRDGAYDYNAKNEAAQGTCGDCKYANFTTGLVHTKGLLKYGYVEVPMELPEGSLEGHLWLQGDHIEISAVEISHDDNTVRGGAYVFNGTKTTSRVTQEYSGNKYDPTVKNVFGIEWQRNHDVRVHINGKPLYVFEGTKWNPNSFEEGVNIILDYSINAKLHGTPEDEFEDDEKKRMLVDYIGVWKLDCEMANDYDMSGVIDGAVPSIVGDACRTASPYMDHCEIRTVKGGEFCYQPEHGDVELGHPEDTLCGSISREARCGGESDWRRGGGQGLCLLVPEYPEGEQCIRKVTGCGSITDSKECNNHESGECSWCFNSVCVQKMRDNQCNYQWLCEGSDQPDCKSKNQCKYVWSDQQCVPKPNPRCNRMNKDPDSCENIHGESCFYKEDSSKCKTRRPCNKLSETACGRFYYCELVDGVCAEKVENNLKQVTDGDRNELPDLGEEEEADMGEEHPKEEEEGPEQNEVVDNGNDDKAAKKESKGSKGSKGSQGSSSGGSSESLYATDNTKKNSSDSSTLKLAAIVIGCTLAVGAALLAFRKQQKGTSEYATLPSDDNGEEVQEATRLLK